MAYVVLSLIYIALVWTLLEVDRWEREPPLLLLGAFFWGAVPSILLAYISLISIGNALAIVVIEELIKALLLFMYVTSYRRELHDWVDMYVYSSLVGLGYGWAEGLVYILYDPHYFIARIILSPLHAIWTSIVGLSIVGGMNGKMVWMWVGLFAAISLHSYHNGVGSDLYIPTLCLYLLTGYAAFIHQERKHHS